MTIQSTLIGGAQASVFTSENDVDSQKLYKCEIECVDETETIKRVSRASNHGAYFVSL